MILRAWRVAVRGSDAEAAPAAKPACQARDISMSSGGAPGGQSDRSRKARIADIVFEMASEQLHRAGCSLGGARARLN